MFNYDWLPIYTGTDLMRCKDILYKMFCEYHSHVGDGPKSLSQPYYTPFMHNEHETRFENYECSLYCLENPQVTSIELKIKQSFKEINTCSNSINVKIYIGQFLIFCSERDLKGLGHVSVTYVLIFILSKLVYNNI